MQISTQDQIITELEEKILHLKAVLEEKIVKHSDAEYDLKDLKISLEERREGLRRITFHRDVGDMSYVFDSSLINDLTAPPQIDTYADYYTGAGGLRYKSYMKEQAQRERKNAEWPDESPG